MRFSKDLYYMIIIFIIFFSYALFLPQYTNNQFKNIAEIDKPKFSDGRSALNFYNLLNIIQNKSLAFDGKNDIEGIKAENYYDFIIGKSNKFYLVSEPFFLFFYLPFVILSNNLLDIYKIIIITNIFYASLTLIFFYKLQIIYKLKSSFALLSSLSMGLMTGWLIYSRIFVDNVFIVFLFITFLYTLFSYLNKRSTKKVILLSILVSLLALMKVPSYIGLFSFPLYLLIVSPSILLLKKSDFRKRNVSIFIIIFLLIFLIPEMIWFKAVTDSFFINPHSLIIERARTSLFSTYPIFIDAESLNVYRYHNQSSELKLERNYSYLYTFSEGKGNAMFLHFYGIFASLFSPRGFVYNSPFLIFSILGLLLYFASRKKEATSLFLIIIINILIFSWFSFVWYGGSSPRYVKFYFPTVFLLNYFTFYYLQNNFRNKVVLIIFSILSILSFLNVSSLSVRTDWTFEHAADLVSYDLAIWPFNYQKQVSGNFTENLATFAEVSKWDLNGEVDCKARYSAGIITDICQCKFNSWAEREIKIPKESSNIEVKACSKNSGGDGIFGIIRIDSEENKFFIKSNECTNSIFNIKKSIDLLRIKISSEINGTCSEEMVLWEKIKIN